VRKVRSSLPLGKNVRFPACGRKGSLRGGVATGKRKSQAISRRRPERGKIRRLGKRGDSLFLGLFDRAKDSQASLRIFPRVRKNGLGKKGGMARCVLSKVVCREGRDCSWIQKIIVYRQRRKGVTGLRSLLGKVCHFISRWDGGVRGDQKGTRVAFPSSGNCENPSS